MSDADADSNAQDADLRRAIALSLQDDSDEARAFRGSSVDSQATTASVASDGADAGSLLPLEDEDADLKRAIALSLQETRAALEDDSVPSDAANSKLSTRLTSEEAKKPSPLPGNTNRGLFGGMDRKAMEAERLARLARKRKVEGHETTTSSISPPPRSDREAKKAKIATTTPSTLSTPSSQTTRSKTDPNSNTVRNPTTNSPSFPNVPQYPRGVVKLTASTSHPDSDHTVTFADVLQADHLKLAVLSAFQWDIRWLLGKVNQRTTKMILVMQAKDEATQRSWRADVADAVAIRLCFPPMPGNVSCMHSKLMILGYGDVLRIVVPSANLTAYDWGETGVMENSCFIIDLPRRRDGGRAATSAALGMFGRELVRFCEAMTLDAAVVESLYEFDFSGAEGLAFVHSIGGEHTSSYLNGGDTSTRWRETGYTGLGRAVKELGLQTFDKDKLEIDFVASSVGSLSDDFVSTLYLACCGDDGSTEFNWRTNAENYLRHAELKSQGKKGPREKVQDPDLSEQAELVRTAKENFRLFFPSEETVACSIGGNNAAGTICLQRKWYEGPKFPKMIMRDCESKREGLLMHNKMLFVRPKYRNPADIPAERRNQQSKSRRAWAYVGSANCSDSAWGKLSLNKSTKLIKLTCRNWECGVLIPVSHSSEDNNNSNSIARGKRSQSIGHPDSTMSARDDNDLETTFANTIPIPMKWPGDAMGAKEPWYFGRFD